MRDRTVLVTGGTGALGGAVVDAFLDAGWRVVCTWVVPGERERMGERDGLELVEADLFDEEAVDGRRAAGGGDRRRAAARGREPGRRVPGRAAGGRDDAGGVRGPVQAEPAPHLPGHAGGAAAAGRGRRRRDRVHVRAGRRCGRSRAPPPTPPRRRRCSAFAQAVAVEYRDEGVRCNAVLPSVIDTPANRAAEPDADHSRWVPARRDRARGPVPVLRGLGPGERRRGPRLRARVAPASPAPRAPPALGGQGLVPDRMALLGHRRARQAADRADRRATARPCGGAPPRSATSSGGPAAATRRPANGWCASACRPGAGPRSRAGRRDGRSCGADRQRDHSGRVDDALVLHLVIGSQRAGAGDSSRSPALPVLSACPEGPNSARLTTTPGNSSYSCSTSGSGRARGREQELVHVQEGDPARVVAHVAPTAVLEGGEDAPSGGRCARGTACGHSCTDRDALVDVGGEHLAGDRPCCRCRTGRTAPRRPAGGTRSTPAGTSASSR